MTFKPHPSHMVSLWSWCLTWSFFSASPHMDLKMRTEILHSTSCYCFWLKNNRFQHSITLQTRQFSAVESWLTWVVWQVREADRLALHLVWEATQEDVDINLLCDVLVLVGWSLKHDGDLPVNVCLGKLSARLPRPSPEDDLYVICGSVTTHTDMLINLISIFELLECACYVSSLVLGALKSCSKNWACPMYSAVWAYTCPPRIAKNKTPLTESVPLTFLHFVT